MSDLIADPVNQSRFFAAVRTAGIFRSDDTGATWTNMTSNLTGITGTTTKVEMAMFNNGASTAVFVAVITGSNVSGLWRSTNLGTTWTQMDTPNTGGQGEVHFAIASDPGNPNLCYVGGQANRYRCDASLPLGSQLTLIQGVNASNTTPHADTREMFIDAAGRLLDVGDGGLYHRSSPQGNVTAWLSGNGNLATFEAHNVAYCSLNDIAMIGTQDNGTHIQTSSGSTVWQWINGGDGGDVAIDDQSSPGQSIRYGSSQNLGGFFRKTYNSSNTLVSTVYPALTVLAGGPAIGVQFTTGVELNKVDPTRLIIGGSNAAYESLNRGDSVTALTPISGVGGTYTGKPIAYGGWLSGVPNVDVLYYGSGSAVKLRATAGGAVTDLAYPGGTVNDIVLDRNDYRHLFVASSGTVYHSFNSGGSWTNITGDLTGVGTLHTIEFFRLNGTDCIAVGTDIGVYCSFVTSLGTWQKLGSGFPNAIVFDMKYSEADSMLVVGTLGRSCFKLPIHNGPLVFLTMDLTTNPVTEGASPVTATLTATPAPVSDLTITLTSGDTTEATVPTTATILAGQTTTTFPVTVINDTLLDGTQTANLTASAADYADGSAALAVQDDETATLSVTIPATTTEGAGTVQGTVTVSSATGSDVTVSLSSSDITAITVPAMVTILSGQTSANFSIGVIDDNKIDGSQTATVTAQVVNWTSGTSPSIEVQDNESLNLVMSLPAAVNEGSTGTGTVSISGTRLTSLIVSLSSNTTSRLTVPATVTITAGATSANFTLSTVNNALTDGNATVTVTASASGFTGTGSTTSVVDNDLHHYVINAIASPQTRGAPFSVTITAQNIGNQTITGYTSTAAMSAAGAGGADSITPTTTTAFTAGVWTGNVTVNTFDTNVVLTASDGAGHTGASNAFNVGTGALHHFAWNSQAARARNAAVNATLTAQDAGNNAVTGFTGTAALNCGSFSRNVGTGTASSTVLPLYTYYEDQRSQCIYLQSEVGAAGTIKGMTLNVTTLPGQTMNNWTIRMKHTALSSYATASWESTGWTTVYQANQTISTTGLTTFTFTTPFVYDGVSNLMVDFSFNNSSWTSAGAVVYTTTSPTRSIHYYTDSGYGDPLTWSGTTSPTPLNSSVLPNLQFVLDLNVSMTPTVTGNFTSGTWSGPIVIQQFASAVTLRADDGAGHIGDSNAFDVTGTLALSVPPSAPEDSAPLTGTVSVPAAPAGNLTVTLTSSDATAATVPATVTILSGQTSATFPITIIDDVAIDGTQVATITAHINNWTDATANISVLDNESLSLGIFLPGSVSEGSTATVTVSASGTVATALTVALVSDTTSRLTVPATVTIPIGSSSVTFNVTAVDNALTDGSAVVNVAASAAGYAGANTNTTVLDNDVHHFSIAPIASPQTKGVPFNVTITAFDVGNAILTGYSGSPGLTATGTGGANAILPANASGFINGVWTGQVTAFITDTSVVITVNDGAGHTGASSAFNVINPLFSPTVVESVSPTTPLNGVNPKAQLVVGADGSFYGTTQFGGSSNQGAVFKVTSAGVMTTLANFYGANGAVPLAGLVLASDGNFYGSTSAGGSNNLGTIFKMTPSGVLTTLANLSTTTGSSPRAPLIQATDANFYGTTSANGSGSNGTIIKMTSSGVITVMANFTGTTGSFLGSSCQAALIQAADTNLYGITSTGGNGGGFGNRPRG